MNVNIDIKSAFAERRHQLMAALFVLLSLAVIGYSKYSGVIMLGAFLSFGIISALSNNRQTRIISLALLILISIINMGFNGIRFGIDFSGGTRIPIVLERPVDDTTMNEMVSIIKSRASVMGLSEVKVRAVGNTQIDVEVPGTNEQFITSIEDVLSHQGVFMGVVDGKIAVSGSEIIPGTIYTMSSSALQGADWGVGFSVTKEGAENFAVVAKGKGDFPLYMFLDRPKSPAVFLSAEQMRGTSALTDEALLAGARKALAIDSDNSSVYILDDFNYSVSGTGRNAVVESTLDNATVAKIAALGFNITRVGNITPTFSTTETNGEASIEDWTAVGLITAPRLNPSITNGLPYYSYSVSGSAKGASSTEKAQYSAAEARKIVSLLKGGSLPVQITLGSRTSIPSPLGQQFLQLSVLGVFASIIAISLFVALRYRHMRLVVPIIIVSVSELVILVSMLGSFTVDLAAMAGILAALGVGVDAQIVITDELLKKGTQSHDERLASAFRIVSTNVAVAVVAMVPIFFSGMVEIIGFALSTIIGSLLGFMISRPVYAIIVETFVE
jgi:preprotein translocase subunit SecD